MSAWTAPKTWADGEVPTAAILNAQISGNAQYLYDHKVSHAATQSLPSRSLATPYTNGTGKILHVLVTMSNTSSMEASITVGGVVQGYVRRGDAIASYLPFSVIVAPGETYQVDIVSGSGSIYKWCETIIG